MAIDPVGKQGKIPGGWMRVSMDKRLENVGDLGGGFNKKSGTRGGSFSDSWQGKTKGGTKHTYGKNGKNDSD